MTIALLYIIIIVGETAHKVFYIFSLYLMIRLGFLFPNKYLRSKIIANIRTVSRNFESLLLFLISDYNS